jgi:hypothetical protein
MPCSHCKQEGHNKKTCLLLKELQLQEEIDEKIRIQEEKKKEDQRNQSLLIQQQRIEYEIAEQADLERQKKEEIDKQLAEPSLTYLRELRLNHYLNK